ncbi:rhodanese-like domain-containing protein [Undibacterium sp. Ji50W]|uniref:rhodanese-like domain-containing protein n=1 Tax=Undibacterium sp. Ji50W TaxID=3413041 RepID=UPI003BEFC68D
MTDSTYASTELPSASQAGETRSSGSEDHALANARSSAQAAGLAFSGSLAPADAWRLLQSAQAILVDVRTAEERKFVGYVADAVHVPWATGTALTRNPRFVKELEAKVKDKSRIILLLCRSGKRSTAAAEAAAKAGFSNIFNVAEGFEGDLNPDQQRGQLGGWRFHQLPWIQD